jgi:hypothetical protein
MPVFYDGATAQSHYRAQIRGPVVRDSVVLEPAVYEFGPTADFPGLLGNASTRKDWLTGYGLDNNANVLVVGSGFGYLIDFLIGQGVSDVWGIEPGAFYWDPTNASYWPAGVQARTANDWIGSGTEQTSLDALAGVPNNEKFGWVVTEDVATCHSDADLPAFITACEARLQGNAKGRIVHMVSARATPFGDPNLNAKTMQDWSLVAPDHTWVDLSNGDVWRNGAQVAF